MSVHRGLTSRCVAREIKSYHFNQIIRDVRRLKRTYRRRAHASSVRGYNLREKSLARGPFASRPNDDLS